MPRSNSYDGVPHSGSTRSTLSYRSRSQRSQSRGKRRGSVKLVRPPKIRRSAPDLLLNLGRVSPSRSAKRAANMILDFNDSPTTIPGSVLSDFSPNSQREKEKSRSPLSPSIPSLYSSASPIYSRPHSRRTKSRSKSRSKSKSQSPPQLM